MHKDKFSGKKKLLAIAFLSFLAPLQATGTGSICISTESKIATIKISKLLNAKINVHACSGDAGSGELSVKISIDAKNQEFLFPYDAPAYSLAIDTSMDLNNDGILDLGVSSGGGRGGEGMWYWAFDKSNGVFAYLGEAPALSIDTSKGKRIFATLSGSGDVQAVRYNYSVKDLKLVISDAAAFVPSDSSYRVVIMDCDASSVCKQTRVIEKVPTLLAQGCMAGTHECKFSN